MKKYKAWCTLMSGDREDFQSENRTLVLDWVADKFVVYNMDAQDNFVFDRTWMHKGVMIQVNFKLKKTDWK